LKDDRRSFPNVTGGRLRTSRRVAGNHIFSPLVAYRLSLLERGVTLKIPILSNVAGSSVDTKSSPQNIQDAFLNTARRERDTVTIYLMNGAKLSGRIKSFDKFSVLLESGSQEQLIFKHAISTISHARRGSGDLRTSQAGSFTSTDNSSEPSNPADA
jgi:host factor-I protein